MHRKNAGCNPDDGEDEMSRREQRFSLRTVAPGAGGAIGALDDHVATWNRVAIAQRLRAGDCVSPIMAEVA